MRKPARAAALLGSKITDGIVAVSRKMPPAEAEIRSLRTASNQAIAAGNLAAVSSSLADDFVVILGDGTLLSRAEYLQVFDQSFRQPVPLLYERIADLIRPSSSLPLAAEQGHWIGRLAKVEREGQILFTGTYMAMWRETSAGWLLRSELFVTLT